MLCSFYYTDKFHFSGWKTQKRFLLYTVVSTAKNNGLHMQYSTKLWVVSFIAEAKKYEQLLEFLLFTLGSLSFRCFKVQYDDTTAET